MEPIIVFNFLNSERENYYNDDINPSKKKKPDDIKKEKTLTMINNFTLCLFF